MTSFQKWQIDKLPAPTFAGETRSILKEPMKTPVYGVEDFDPNETVEVIYVVATRKWKDDHKWLVWEIRY